MIRRAPERDSGDEAVADFEVVDARFGLLPGFATEVKYGTRTYNARSETVASLASFKQAWAKARHCIVPCEAIYEPDWRTGDAHSHQVHRGGWRHPWRCRPVATLEVARGRMGHHLHDADPQR